MAPDHRRGAGDPPGRRDPAPAGDLAVALDAAFAAGQATLEWFGQDPEVRHKGPDQPVTAADLAADDVLHDRLAGARPDYGWLSEESPGRQRLDVDRVWVVDPIDGTRSFVRGYSEFTVCVALVAGEVVDLGVVYNPASGEAVWAERGGGARGADAWAGDLAEGRRLEVRTERPAGPPLLFASRSEIRRGEFAPFDGDWRVTPLGSTAYKLASVAMGAGDAYISRGPKSAWDVTAGALIVEEAGGRVTDLEGRPVRLDRADGYVHGIVAAAREDLHRALLEQAAALPSDRLDPQRGG